LVDFYQGSSDCDFGDERFNDPDYLAFFIMKGGVDLMRFDSNRNSRVDPLYLVFLFLVAPIFLLEFIIESLDVIQFFLVEGYLFLVLFFQFFY
jgi:hypothetical protein